MLENNMNNNPMQGNLNSDDPNRPRLRKVKRPRMNAAPATPNVPPKTTFESANRTNAPAADPFDLDEILDREANLPSIRNEVDDFDETPQFINESDLVEEKVSMPFMVGDMFSKKAVGIIALIVFLFGFGFAKIFFSQETVVRDGLQGVVINPEVPRGRARCGVAEKIQGCVLYIMNPQRQDLDARDFYDLAAQLTGRQRFVIETGNMRYSNVKIRPGNIAQLNIPPLQ